MIIRDPSEGLWQPELPGREEGQVSRGAPGRLRPMNLGAVIRLAYYLGVDRVVTMPEYPSSSLTPGLEMSQRTIQKMVLFLRFQFSLSSGVQGQLRCAGDLPLDLRVERARLPHVQTQDGLASGGVGATDGRSWCGRASGQPHGAGAGQRGRRDPRGHPPAPPLRVPPARARQDATPGAGLAQRLRGRGAPGAEA